MKQPVVAVVAFLLGLIVTALYNSMSARGPECPPAAPPPTVIVQVPVPVPVPVLALPPPRLDPVPPPPTDPPVIAAPETAAPVVVGHPSEQCETAFPSYKQFRKHYDPHYQKARAFNRLQVAEHQADEWLVSAYLNTLRATLRGETLQCGGGGMASCNHGGVHHEWPHLGDTMLMPKCMDCLKDVIKDVGKRKVPGEYLEAGVWRGGASIFARKVMAIYGMGDRHSFVCDSFEGLPAPRHGDRDPEDRVYKGINFLGVPLEDVQNNFAAYCELNDRVHFYKGYFVNSMPKVRQYLLDHNMKLSVLRADGDMYDSTIDILYNLYDLVEVGGYIVIDDFGWTSHDWKARDAVMDFRRIHDIEDKEHRFVNCGGHSAYFRKTREVKLQFERYKAGGMAVLPEKRISQADYDNYRLQWEAWMRTDPLLS
jgi:hypothetical protein